MFSSRVPPNRQPNRLSGAIRQARAAGRDLIDLTATNPTTVGIAYPCDLLQPLASGSALVYTPHPFGLPEAREAVADDYARRSIAVARDRIVLTASTSEAYSLLFKLLCNPGDTVLVPVPSYPLFEHLTSLDGVRTRTYALEYHGRWDVDIASVDRVWSNDTRAVLGVSPNNPTGSALTRRELAFLESRCASGGAALILDEVFADYRLDHAGHTDLAFESRALTFRLGGLSKSAGLPQAKLGWIAVDGPDAMVEEALERLELICDTYLSVSTPVQVAAPDLIRAGAHVRHEIQQRIVENYEQLRRSVTAHPSLDLLYADGGWSAVVRVPSTRSEEELVLELLERDNVLVHPGFFFDFPHESFVVVSLLPEPARFAEGVRRLMERADA